MTIERKVRILFVANAMINWVVSVPGIIDPGRIAVRLGGIAPNYPSVVRLWLGLVFMFGCMFWEVSRDPRGKAALLKYNWIEKSITAAAITLGFASGDVPAPVMTLVVFTNWVWIPFVFWADVAIRRPRP